MVLKGRLQARPRGLRRNGSGSLAAEIYLGFDLSTQSLTATAIEAGEDVRRVLFTRSFRFDDELVAYGTTNGVLPHADPTVVHAPPLMWAEALEKMFGLLTAGAPIDWKNLRAISGSAQQHGSVYLQPLAAGRLARLDPAVPLARQLANVFSRPSSPVWMDSSTTRQCAEIEAALGGPDALKALTGSRAFERFTGPQIRKFAQDDPDAYERTRRIHLVSSWMASLLTGGDAGIDVADGSGMNLMELRTGTWSREAAVATAPDLIPRLPPLIASHTVVGTLAAFWREKFSLPPAHIVAWSGDNPCSLVGTGVVDEGTLAISLGTSDTIFGIMREPRMSDDGTGHVFASPAGGFMGMTVFKNGSLARERIRDAYGLDWAGFSQMLSRAPAGNHGRTMLPWFEPEITPLVLEPRVERFGLEPDDAEGNVRAVVEAQMLALRLHSEWMGLSPHRLVATGGAAANRAIVQVMADVFEKPVLRIGSANSAALGAALRAWHGDLVRRNARVEWAEIVHGFAKPEPVAAPTPDRVATYQTLLQTYAARERQALAR
jgi:xylulokinase